MWNKRKKVIYTITFLAFFFLYGFAKACSCPPQRCFLQEISGEELIIRVRVLGHSTLPVSLISNELLQLRYPYLSSQELTQLPPLPVGFYGFTRLVVEEVYAGVVKSDTIGFYNGAGSMCHGRLDHYSIGSQLVLKLTDQASNNYHQLDTLRSITPFVFDHPMYAASICENWLLNVEHNLVIGYIADPTRYELLNRLHEEGGTMMAAERNKLVQRVSVIQPERLSLVRFRGLILSKVDRLD
jgi:hypothetical protein